MHKIGDKILVELTITHIVENKNGFEYITEINPDDYIRTIRVHENEIVKTKILSKICPNNKNHTIIDKGCECLECKTIIL